MRLHRAAVFVVALLTAAILTIGGIAPAWAASQVLQSPARAAAPALQATHEISKIVLPETSIDGPALSSVGSESAIAWTGTDALHHLNVETSSDGLDFGNKLTLHETSSYRPDVTLTSDGGPITVAWTGTDANHSLNVFYDVYGSSPKKLTLLNENSFTAPGVTLIGSYIYLAWTGTDANHSLNMLPINYTGSSLVPGTKTVLPQFSSNAGPRLTRRGATTLVLDWTSRGLQPIVATSQDGVHFSSAGLPEASAFAPDTSSIEPYIGVSNREWIGWTGTDVAHHLNLQWTTSFPNFTNPAGTKTVLGETALGGPALSYNGGEQLAWTGTDAAHHVNIAKYVFG